MHGPSHEETTAYPKSQSGCCGKVPGEALAAQRAMFLRTEALIDEDGLPILNTAQSNYKLLSGLQIRPGQVYSMQGRTSG